MLILKNSLQYKYLKGKHPDLLGAHQILATTVQMWLELRNESFEMIDLESIRSERSGFIFIPLQWKQNYERT